MLRWLDCDDWFKLFIFGPAESFFVALIGCYFWFFVTHSAHHNSLWLFLLIPGLYLAILLLFMGAFGIQALRDIFALESGIWRRCVQVLQLCVLVLLKLLTLAVVFMPMVIISGLLK